MLHLGPCNSKVDIPSRLLKKIEVVWYALNQQDAILKVLPHLSKTGDDIVREVLAFLAAMLFGGNESVQVILHG